MATASLRGVVWHLRQAAFRAEAASSTDGELLDRYLADRDETAFAALVRRHGPMVYGVCRRTLINESDAEDAFQATFLVLARKAHAVRPGSRVGHWLYGVALNTARKARVCNRRRINRERRAAERRRPYGLPADMNPLGEVLDLELNRLPDKYRETVVLCDLEGHAIADAARRLDCPPGTVASRLARAREILRRNLSRRGIAAAAITALLAPSAATAVVPSQLVKTTALAATGAGPISTHVLTLTEGVVHAMFLSKLKMIAAVVVSVGILTAGIGTGGNPALADPPADKAKPTAPDKPVKPEKPAADKPVKPNPDKPEKPAKPNADVKKLPSIHGIVKTVDAAKATITVSIPAKNGETKDQTVTLAKDAQVSVDGAEAKLADLKTGYHVNLKLTEDKSGAVAIAAEGPTLAGELKAVDASKHTIKVVVPTRPDPTDKTKTGTEEKTFTVAEHAKIAIDGQKNATLADLKAGSSVAVRLAADGERAFVITSPAKGGGGPTLVGELKGVAADKKTLTVAVKVLADKTDKSSAKIEEKTIKVADDVKVAVDGKKPATLADLKTGSSVAVHMSKDGERAIAISSPAKGSPSPGGDKKPEKPIKPGTDKPTKPGADKPNTDKPVKPAKPGADKPEVTKPVKGDGK